MARVTPTLKAGSDLQMWSEFHEVNNGDSVN